jgi:hypothetical protein
MAAKEPMRVLVTGAAGTSSDPRCSVRDLVLVGSDLVVSSRSACPVGF